MTLLRKDQQLAWPTWLTLVVHINAWTICARLGTKSVKIYICIHSRDEWGEQGTCLIFILHMLTICSHLNISLYFSNCYFCVKLWININILKNFLNLVE